MKARRWCGVLGAGLLLAALLAGAARADCPPAPAGLAPGNLKVKFTLDSATTWQPPGGEVRFTLTGAGMPADDMTVTACFRWHGKYSEQQWYSVPPLRVIDTKASEITLGVLVPQELSRDAPNWFRWGKAQRVAYTGLGLVPLADFHLVVTSATAKWSPIDIVQQVGVTSIPLSGAMAVVAVVVAWAAFFLWGHWRGVKGGPILRIISSRNGVASLSQFQIMIWTFVIGIGVMYVIALSGSMIDIPTTTLTLLGISGVATVASKLQAGSDGTATPPAPPGAVTGLAVSGAAGAERVVLTWTPPAGAAKTVAYTVQVREAHTLGWRTAQAGVAAPPYAVTGLTPNTAYEFQVFGVNAAGSGPASTPLPAATVAAAAANPAAPGPVTGLTATAGAPPDSQARLTWSALAPAPDAYVVQYRPAGTLAWSTASSAATSPFDVTGLDGGTTYEFQVFAVHGGVAGPASALANATTDVRQPQWSDLVMSGNAHGEVDVTRVQMLLFTLIAAIFVSLKLLDESQIPDIPAGILTLIGISNGVYLTAKFVPGPS